MKIRIVIHTIEPLTGTATAGSKEPLHFEGWLELLRALSALVGAGGYPLGERAGGPRERST